MASGIYPHGFGELFGAENFLTASVKIMLVEAGYVYDPDHKFVADLTPAANELEAANYTGGHGGAGRKALANKAILALDTAANRRAVDADDVTWANLGAPTSGNPVAAVVFIEKTSDADSILLAYLDPVTDPIPNGGNFTYQFPAAGIFGVTA